MIDAHGVEQPPRARHPAAQPPEVGRLHHVPAVHGQAPVLTTRVEGIGRRPDVATEIELVLPGPHVGAVPRDHERKISLQAHAHLGGCPSCPAPLLGPEPLHVLVEEPAVFELARGYRHGRRLPVAERRLPRRPRMLVTALLAGPEQ